MHVHARKLVFTFKRLLRLLERRNRGHDNGGLLWDHGKNMRECNSSILHAWMLTDCKAMTYPLDLSLQQSLIQRAEPNHIFGSSGDVIALRHFHGARCRFLLDRYHR
jgi:hypothetical protein